VNCKTTFEGMFHFSYEVDYGGGGICDSPRSSIIACQEPGSPYVDNQVFFMNYGKCPAIGSSKNKCTVMSTLCYYLTHKPRLSVVSCHVISVVMAWFLIVLF